MRARLTTFDTECDFVRNSVSETRGFALHVMNERTNRQTNERYHNFWFLGMVWIWG